MARKPAKPSAQPPTPPAKWIIYRAAKKAERLSDVEAMDEREAIEKAAEKFDTDASRLARISQTIERIGGANQRKLLCSNDFSLILGAPDADRVYAESV